jgi:hypothetical protein
MHAAHALYVQPFAHVIPPPLQPTFPHMWHKGNRMHGFSKCRLGQCIL